MRLLWALLLVIWILLLEGRMLGDWLGLWNILSDLFLQLLNMNSRILIGRPMAVVLLLLSTIYYSVLGISLSSTGSYGHLLRNPVIIRSHLLTLLCIHRVACAEIGLTSSDELRRLLLTSVLLLLLSLRLLREKLLLSLLGYGCLSLSPWYFFWDGALTINLWNIL